MAANDRPSRHRRRARGAQLAFWPLLAAGAVVLVLVSLQTLHIAQLGAASHGHPERALGLVRQAFPWATILVLIMILIAVTYWYPRYESQSGAVYGLLSGGAAVVIILGVSTYAPCTEGKAWYAPISWIFGLFTGQYEFAPAPASNCATTWAPGMDLARSLGVVITASTALKLIHDFARNWVDRVVVSLSGDVDVVVGLTPMTLRLTDGLARENANTPRRPTWVDSRPPWRRGETPPVLAGIPPFELLVWRTTGLRRGDLRRLIKVRPRTVVIEMDPGNPLIDEARRLGARVVVGDATSEKLLRSVITRLRTPRRRRIALRRLYAVDLDQRRNLAVWQIVSDELTTPPRARHTQLDTHLDDIVPRIFVLLDDSREARQWRIRQMGPRAGALGPADSSQTLISDALTLDGLMAEEVARRLMPVAGAANEDTHPSQIVVIGSSSLALTLLDELAWQVWCRYEVAHAANVLEDHEFRLRKVVLVGPDAAMRKNEWDTLRAPWTYPEDGTFVHGRPAPTQPHIFEVVADEGPAETVAATSLQQDRTATAVFVDDDPSATPMATRLARMYGKNQQGLRVMLRTSEPTSTEPIAPGGILRFVPELVRHDSFDNLWAPSDSVARLAEQQHAVYRAEREVATAGGAAPSPTRHFERRLTGRPWSGPLDLAQNGSTSLPPFFREDNVRQHLRILSWLTDHGYEWMTMTAHDFERHGASNDWEPDLPRIVSAEYERWRDLRIAHGWWPVGTDQPCDSDGTLRNDSLRMHPDLRGEHAIDIGYNADLIRVILHRLQATGLVPAKQGTESHSRLTDGTL